jgi:hypothetical protein
MWAHQQNDEVKIAAADILCQDLTRSLTGKKASDRYFRACSKLADMIIEGKWQELKEIQQLDILFSYTPAPKAEKKEKAAAGKPG